MCMHVNSQGCQETKREEDVHPSGYPSGASSIRIVMQHYKQEYHQLIGSASTRASIWPTPNHPMHEPQTKALLSHAAAMNFSPSDAIAALEQHAGDVDASIIWIISRLEDRQHSQCAPPCYCFHSRAYTPSLRTA